MIEPMCPLPHDEQPIIGLDYDDTFSADPQAWAKAMRVLKAAGYRVIGVTARNRDQAITMREFHDVVESIIYCGGHAKREVTANMDIPIAIWIDDKPEYITSTYEAVHGHKFDASIPDEALVPVLVARYDRPPPVERPKAPKEVFVCTCGGGTFTCNCP